MKNIKVNRKNLEDFFKILIKEDKEEVQYCFKENAKENFIQTCLKLKNKKDICFKKDKNSKPVALGGVVKVYKDDYKIGKIWLLVSKNYKKEKISLFKIIKNNIENYKKNYDILYNYIYKSNFKALIWLKRLGFKEIECRVDNNYKIFYYKKGEKI